MKKYIIDYYNHTRNFYNAYGNRKEVSAWAALVLHLAFCSMIINAKLQSFVANKIELGVLVFFSVFIFIYFFLFIKNQLEMKENADAYTGAATKLLSIIILEENISAAKYLKLKKSNDDKDQSLHVLPKILLKKAHEMKCSASGRHNMTKILINLLLITSSVFVLVLLVPKIFMA